mmetsp:Transcript_30119/g.39663  ORF Transcript_30119/g.39663 Transcript_30119/m.39663 type:complete len:124 (-) Transcript_30119:349-720(-)
MDGLQFAAKGNPVVQRSKKKWNRDDFKGKLKKDIEPMMYGFGDSWEKCPDTVDLMENIVIEYIQSFLEDAGEISQLRGRLDADCFVFSIRKDKRKCERIEELLQLDQEIKRIRKNELDEKAYS